MGKPASVKGAGIAALPPAARLELASNINAFFTQSSLKPENLVGFIQQQIAQPGVSAMQAAAGKTILAALADPAAGARIASDLVKVGHGRANAGMQAAAAISALARIDSASAARAAAIHAMPELDQDAAAFLNALFDGLRASQPSIQTGAPVVGTVNAPKDIPQLALSRPSRAAASFDYQEPSDERLLQEINFDIRAKFGGETYNPKLQSLLQEVLEDASKAMGADPKKYTIHILASQSVANAMASPGGHIWITWAALKGFYREYYTYVGREGNERRYNVQPASFFENIQSLPLALAHELGHHENGDMDLLLRRYRRSRRKKILGQSEHHPTWTDLYDQELPGGRTYRQELAADEFAVAAVEEAGYPTKDILASHLNEDSSLDHSHPATSARGWRNGVLSARVPLDKALPQAKTRMQKLEEWRTSGEATPQPRFEYFQADDPDPWTAIDQLASRHLRFREKGEFPPGWTQRMARDFQLRLLDILDADPNPQVMRRLWRLLYSLTGQDAQLLVSGGRETEGPFLNAKTDATARLSQGLAEWTKALNPAFRGTFHFDIGAAKGIDAVGTERSMMDAIAQSLDGYYRRQYNSGRMGFTDYLEEHLSLPLHDRKGDAASLLKLAKTPQDLAEGYYFILRTGRSWNDTRPIKKRSLPDAIASWMTEDYVVGSMYEEVRRGLYDGEHFLTLREKGWLPAARSVEETARRFIEIFARDNGPLYRSAEAWPSGDIAGLLILHPDLASKPEKLKAILDQEGREFFKHRPKATYRVPRPPFAKLFLAASTANNNTGRLRQEADAGALLRLGLHVKANQSLRSMDYSQKLAEVFVKAPGGSTQEKDALARMVAELDANRTKASPSLLRSYMLENHFMGMHPVKSYRKRTMLLEAVLKNGAPRDSLPTFAKSGSLVPKYAVEDRHIYGDMEDYYEDGMSGNGMFHMPYARYDNHYAAALGRLYESVQTLDDVWHMMKTFDFTQAPLLEYKLWVLRWHYQTQDHLKGVSTLRQALVTLDDFFSRDNPFRWVVFHEVWDRFGYDLGDAPLDKVLSALPNLHAYKGISEKTSAERNSEMLNDFLDNLGPRSLREKLEKRYGITLLKSFLKTAQTLEREIYESAQQRGLLSADPKMRLAQVERIFQSSSDSGASHPALDRTRLSYMKTLDIHSTGYRALQDKLRDPEIKTLAAIPFLREELVAGLSHDQQRDLIRKHLPVGEERNRFLDKHLESAQGLTAQDIQRYSHLFSWHPKSELRKKKALLHIKLAEVRRLKPKDKFQLALYFLSHGHRGFLKAPDPYHQDLFLDVGNYLFERNKDEQTAFLANLFLGENSVLSDKDLEQQLKNLLLLAGEASLPRKSQSLLTALFGSLYESMDPWDKGQLLCELMVDSQSPARTADYAPQPHSPERAVKILRLIKGFGPKAAQILRSHKGILGESAEAQRYREAFKEFEEKAQRVDLVEAMRLIEKSFGGRFHAYFRSIDGVLGAGSVKKVLLATLRDGRRVAVKYTDHDYARRVEHSLETLRRTVKSMESWRDRFPDLPILESILAAVEQDLRKEQDLSREHEIYSTLREKAAARARSFGPGLAAYPRTHGELGLPKTDGRVIVESAFEVLSLEDERLFQARGLDRAEAIRRHIREQLEGLLVDGTYDYDARPANWTAASAVEGGIQLGYFDKAQAIVLSAQQHQSLLEMLLSMKSADADQLAAGLRGFEPALPPGYPKASLDRIARVALSRKDANPYLIMQNVVTELEKLKVPMSSSNSLKLSMWLRQLDRYVQMVPGYDLEAAVMDIMMKRMSSR